MFDAQCLNSAKGKWHEEAYQAAQSHLSFLRFYPDLYRHSNLSHLNFCKWPQYAWPSLVPLSSTLWLRLRPCNVMKVTLMRSQAKSSRNIPSLQKALPLENLDPQANLDVHWVPYSVSNQIFEWNQISHGLSSLRLILDFRSINYIRFLSHCDDHSILKYEVDSGHEMLIISRIQKIIYLFVLEKKNRIE